MNDLGLDEPISQSAQHVENERRDTETDGAEDNEAYLEPRFVHTYPAMTPRADKVFGAASGSRLQRSHCSQAPLAQWQARSISVRLGRAGASRSAQARYRTSARPCQTPNGTTCNQSFLCVSLLANLNLPQGSLPSMLSRLSSLSLPMSPCSSTWPAACASKLLSPSPL